jgi:hypothetical protein
LAKPRSTPGTLKGHVSTVRWTETEFAYISNAMRTLRERGEVRERFSDLVRWAFVQSGVLPKSSAAERPKR